MAHMSGRKLAPTVTKLTHYPISVPKLTSQSSFWHYKFVSLVVFTVPPAPVAFLRQTFLPAPALPPHPPSTHHLAFSMPIFSVCALP